VFVNVRFLLDSWWGAKWSYLSCASNDLAGRKDYLE